MRAWTVLLFILALSPSAAAQEVGDTVVPSASTDSVAPLDATPTLPEEISGSRAAQDEEIRSGLQALFDRVSALSEIEVVVEAGIVRLQGTVSEPQAAQRAEELSREADGVLYVENNLRLTTSLADRLEPTIQRVQELGLNAIAFLPLLVVAILIIILSATAGRLLSLWGGPSFLRSRNPFLQALVARIIRSAAVLAGILLALDLLEATALVGAVVGTAGLAGLALGFAFKDIVENYLAGVLLALRQPFSQNDHVLLEGFEGKVVRLTPRETILMTLEGNHVRLPNAMVFGSAMLNYTRNPRRRFQFEVGVGPGDDLTLAQEVGVKTLVAMAGVLDTPAPESWVQGLGDSTVTVRFLGWVNQKEADFARVRGEAIRLVKIQLEAAGVSLPSPEYLIRMQSDEDPARAPERTSMPQGSVEESQGDVSVDYSVDQQIAEDQDTSDEGNLLGADTNQ